MKKLIVFLLVASVTKLAAQPAAPALVSPANGATNVSTSPYLDWNISSGADSYRLQVSTSSDFSTTVFDQSGLTTSGYTVSGLSNLTTYYWRVNATNSTGTSAWSAVWSFTTVPLLPPALVSPTNGATSVSTSPLLDWNSVSGATSYRLQVSTDSSFLTTIFDQSGITTSSKTVSSLSISTTYYWRVNAKNSTETTAWSAVWSFTTVPVQTPTLVSPANAARDVSTSPTLTWNSSAGAASYRLQVSTSSSFSTTVFDQSGLIETSQFISGLSTSTRYYWRVKAANASFTSAWSAAWDFRTVPPPPAAPPLYSPANGATNVSNSPLLDWRSVSGADGYRLQVSTDSSFLTTIFDQSGITTSSKSMSGLSSSTTYYWRANAMNAGGTSGWSTVWSFTTVLTVPPAPVLASPANGATNVSTSWTLTWNAATGASSYRLQVSTSSSFSTTVLDQSGITITSQSISGLLTSTSYYWRVNATNAAGTSGWSAVSSFTTVPPAPAVPVLASPVDGVTNVATLPTLSWNASTGASSYRLQVSTSSSFSTTVFDQSGLTSTSQAISGLLTSTTYYWRVNATNAGGTSGWSAVSSFTTVPPAPAVPVLASPVDGATNVATSPTLSWNASTGASSYRLQISTSSLFTTTIFDSSGITSTSQAISSLLTSTTYYWRVNATNAGGTSGWSAVSSFTTVLPPPAVPALASPVDGATNVSTSPTLSWNASTGASSYRLQISTSSLFTTTIFDSSGTTSTSQAISGLSTSTTYHWRVNATNANGTSGWSAVRSFTTVPPAPAVPVLASPVDGATNVATLPTLSWNASTGASSYRLQISTSSLFTTTIFDSSGITSTSQAISGLSTSTTYYWRVNATNAGGTSGWSAVSSFTTITSPPSAPTLVSPADGATNVFTSPTISWNTSTGASSYRLQVSTNSSFTTTVFDSIGITGTLQSINGLSTSTAYYWRVSAANGAGTSGWTTVWSFTTVPPPPATPTLASPADGTTDVSTFPVLSWNTSTGASSYHVQVSTNSNFSTTVFDQSGITNASQTISGLNTTMTYYWRVKAENAGGTSAWSAISSFVTIPSAPAVSIVTFPSNGATGVSNSPSLSWNSSTGASSYQLQVSTSSSFFIPVFNLSGITTTSQSLSELSPSTIYYGRVNASNAGGSSGWSAVSSFTTALIIPEAPMLVSPTYVAADVSISTSLVWDSSPGATSYTVQWSTDSTFTVANSATSSSTSYTLAGLSTSMTYYWRVRAENTNGTSIWSPISSFTTVPPAPAITTLVSPPDGATNLSASPTFTWNASSGAASYTIQWSTNTSFTIADSASSTLTSFALSGLLRSTTYYWRVRAMNSNGLSPWSTIRSFTTIPSPPIVPTPIAPCEQGDSPTLGTLDLSRIPSALQAVNRPSTPTMYCSEINANSVGRDSDRNSKTISKSLDF